MSRFRLVATVAFAVIVVSSGWQVSAQVEDPCGGDRGARAGAVFVPSPEHPTIQAGVCAVDDHGTVFLDEGIYEERVRIRGKHVNIQGRGNPNQPEGWPELRATTPPEFVPAERAQGTVTLEGGGSLSAQRIRFVGGDAQIRVEADAGPLRAMHVFFDGGWRGILHLSPGSLYVSHAAFHSQLHNGISFNPAWASPPSGECSKKIFVSQSFFQGQAYVAVLIKNCGSEDISIGDAFFMGLALLSIEGTGAGGLLLVNSGPLHFDGLDITHATGFGIAAFGSSLNLTNSGIQNTHANSAQKWGDGIVAMPLGFHPFGRPSHLELSNVEIADSDRAGLSNFGSFASLANVQISCAAWELEGEPLSGYDFSFQNQGGNLCGCPTANHSCTHETVGLEAPDPLGAIE